LEIANSDVLNGKTSSAFSVAGGLGQCRNSGEALKALAGLIYLGY
jgi:hypothetical protein